MTEDIPQYHLLKKADEVRNDSELRGLARALRVPLSYLLRARALQVLERQMDSPQLIDPAKQLAAAAYLLVALEEENAPSSVPKEGSASRQQKVSHPDTWRFPGREGGSQGGSVLGDNRDVTRLDASRSRDSSY